MSNLREDQSKLEREFREIENELAQPNMANLRNQLDFRYKIPHNFNTSNVLGKMMRLFKIKDQKFSNAIEAVAGGAIHNVVVKTANTGKELIANNAVPFRVTYLPLDRI